MENILFRFFLNFKNDGFGRVEISEPHKFDGASFSIEQDKKRYGRDIFYGNEEINLEFYDGVFENGLTHEFKQLMRYLEIYGFESEVEFIVNKNGIDFTVGVLDFAKYDSDEFSYFKTKVIQNTNQATIKRREDIAVDLFSDEDLDGNPITPISTTRILLKAKPIDQRSRWGNKNLGVVQQVGSAFNCQISIPISNQLLVFGIDDTFAPFDPYFKGLDVSFEQNNAYRFANRLITAKTSLSNLKLRLKNLTFSGNTNLGTFALNISRAIFSTDGTWISNVGSTIRPIEQTGSINVSNLSLEIDLPDMSAGESLIVDVGCFFASSAFLSFNMFFNNFSIDSVELIITSTAIDSVLEGVRDIDLKKQVVKSINGMDVIAPKYDAGGAFYDNFVFNGKLLRQITNEPFYATFKDAFEQLQELNADYQINKDGVYIGQYNDFYSNNELEAFIQAPDDEAKSVFNDRYLLNSFEYKYKSFEQDRDEGGTIDAVHTDTQWLLPNRQVETNLKINVPFVRDPFEIESTRRQNILSKDTTSLSNDDKIYILDCIPLPPDSRNSFTAVLKYQITQSNNTLKLLSNGNFRWDLLGFNVGNTVFVNGDSYTVDTIETNVLTLIFLAGFPTSDSTGSTTFTVDYPLTNVAWVNRTNQEFQNIENIANPENYSNLQYTIKRNMQYWFAYLKTACDFVPNGIIRNTYFKSNGELITEFRNGGNIKENENINISEMPDAILSSKLYETTVIADFESVVSVLNQMETINTDDSIGGFIRIQDNNGKVLKVYPQKLTYLWASSKLEILGEVKKESQFLEVNKVGNLIYIDEVGYDRDIVYPLNLKTEGNYITLYDYRGIALTNEKKYDKVRVNSIIFSNIVELTDALLTL